MATFAVFRERGPAWDWSRPLEAQDGWMEHAAFMEALVADGFVRLGGPLGDERRVLLVVEAESEAAVRERLAGDPWPEEMLRLAAIEPWQLRLGRLS